MTATTAAGAAPAVVAGRPLRDRGLLWAVVAGLLIVYVPTFVWLYGRWTMTVIVGFPIWWARLIGQQYPADGGQPPVRPPPPPVTARSPVVAVGSG